MKDSRKPGKARETSSQVSRAPGGAPGYGRRAICRGIHTHSWAVANGLAGWSEDWKGKVWKSKVKKVWVEAHGWSF